MQNRTKARSIRTAWGCWATAMFAICSSPFAMGSELLDRFKAALPDERSVGQFVTGITTEQALDLCDEIGAESGPEAKSQQGIADLCRVILSRVERKADISPERLLGIAQDRKKSGGWRGCALLFSTGHGGVTSAERVELERAFPVYLTVMQDATEPDSVRIQAVSAAGQTLSDAYTALAAKLDAQGPVRLPPGRDPLRRATFDTPEWRRLESLNQEFFRVCAGLLGSAVASSTFKVNGVSWHVGMMAHVRGARTPGLAGTLKAMQDLLESQEATGWDRVLRERLSVNIDGTRRILRDGGEHHE